jgi:hypothetical protein
MIDSQSASHQDIYFVKLTVNPGPDYPHHCPRFCDHTSAMFIVGYSKPPDVIHVQVIGGDSRTIFRVAEARLTSSHGGKVSARCNVAMSYDMQETKLEIELPAVRCVRTS